MDAALQSAPSAGIEVLVSGWSGFGVYNITNQPRYDSKSNLARGGLVNRGGKGDISW